MGGKAFLSLLPDATFPRLSPAIYASLKSDLLSCLTPLFQYVGVPHEAPEKRDHGDIDFIAACPHAAIGHEEIKIALRASVCIPSPQSDGGGTHNFALRLTDVVTPQPDETAPSSGETGEVYVQIDVNICKDAQDWENVMIFHAYGDLGMIMGRLAASVGLHLGELGLKVSRIRFVPTSSIPTCSQVTSQALVPTYSPYFALSSSIPDIFPFFGLSMEQWRAGFATQRDAFEWIASSRFYVPRHISDRTSRPKSRADRSMYQAFLHWGDARLGTSAENDRQPQETREAEEKEAIIESVRREALAFFGKQEEHDALVEANERRLRLKAIWNGKRVGEWTGGNSRVVGKVMKLLRQTIGEEKIGQMTEEELKQHVFQAKETVELQFMEEQQAKDEGREDAKSI
jgi:hypothetical protein